MLRYFIDQGISVNYYISGPIWISSPTDPYDEYGDPIARAEAEWAAVSLDIAEVLIPRCIWQLRKGM